MALQQQGERNGVIATALILECINKNKVTPPPFYQCNSCMVYKLPFKMFCVSVFDFYFQKKFQEETNLIICIGTAERSPKRAINQIALNEKCRSFFRSMERLRFPVGLLKVMIHKKRRKSPAG